METLAELLAIARLNWEIALLLDVQCAKILLLQMFALGKMTLV